MERSAPESTITVFHNDYVISSNIFHWQCLDSYASQLPETTAPAGYVCPSCSMCIIPLTNQGGPIAEVLRQKILSSAKWAKPNRQSRAAVQKTKNAIQPKSNETLAIFDDSKLLDTSVDAYASQFLRDQAMVIPPTVLPKPVETVVPIEFPTIGTSSISRLEYKGNCSDEPKPFQKFGNPRNLVNDDDDADKYRRHSVAAFNSDGRVLGFTRCIASALPRLPHRRRILCIFVLVILTCFATILIANLFAIPPPSEDAPMPAQPHLPAGV
ncbi:Zinc finger protein-like 1 [Taenia crassiceps]|uniref:Zinc finger protein-like 1 n=1 Tax=Taenia crassiceps TaxID=6207 RepID=A0ABR4QGX6_9CEST